MLQPWVSSICCTFSSCPVVPAPSDRRILCRLLARRSAGSCPTLLLQTRRRSNYSTLSGCTVVPIPSDKHMKYHLRCPNSAGSYPALVLQTRRTRPAALLTGALSLSWGALLCLSPDRGSAACRLAAVISFFVPCERTYLCLSFAISNKSLRCLPVSGTVALPGHQDELSHHTVVTTAPLINAVLTTFRRPS